jgi:predicted transcriptional regulator
MEIDSSDPLFGYYAACLGNNIRIRILEICRNEVPQSHLHKLLKVSQGLISGYVKEMIDLGLLSESRRKGIRVIKTEYQKITFNILPFSSDA